MKSKLRIGALVSGGGSNLQAIMDSCKNGKINGEVVFVGADNKEAHGLKRAANDKIPTFYVDYKTLFAAYRENPSPSDLPGDFNYEHCRAKQILLQPGTPEEKIKYFLITRCQAESRLLEAMKPYPFDLLVLAGFMRNFSPYFIDHVNIDSALPRIMNIHPALLPAFPGTDGYGDTYRYGCKVGGCTVHFIDYGEDSGPIIGQRAFSIEPGETLADVKEKGLKLEWELYSECIQLFAEKKLKLVKKKGNLANGKTRANVEIIPKSLRK